MVKVGLIGTGKTGAATALGLISSQEDFLEELKLYNRNNYDGHVNKAEAVYNDLVDASYCRGNGCNVSIAEDIESLKEMDVIINAIKEDYDVNALEGDKRREGLKYDLPLIASVGSRLKGYEGKILMVTNPVDIMARVLAETSHLDPAQIFSFGTSLDSSRIKSVLGENGYSTDGLEAEFVGEHGPSGVIRFSRLKNDDGALQLNEEERKYVEEEVKKRGYSIVSSLGTSLAGPAAGIRNSIVQMFDEGKDLLGVPYEVEGPSQFIYTGLPVSFTGWTYAIEEPSISSEDEYTKKREEEERHAFDNSVAKIESFTEEALELLYENTNRFSQM